MRLVSACCRVETETPIPDFPEDHFCGKCGKWLSPELHRRGIDQVIFVEEEMR